MEMKAKPLHIVWTQMKEEMTYGSEDILSEIIEKEVSELKISEVSNINIDILNRKEGDKCF
jgi:hypothetical protein